MTSSQMVLVASRNSSLSLVASNELGTHFLHPRQSSGWIIKPKTEENQTEGP